MATETPVDSELSRITRVRRLAKSGQAKRIREEAGASLRDIGTDVGVYPGTVYRWESGLTRPGHAHALRWEAALARLVEELGW